MKEFLEPSNEDRKKKKIFLSICFLMVVAAFAARKFSEGLPPCEQIAFLLQGIYLGFAVLLFTFVWTIRISVRAIKFKQFPPPDILILGRERLLRGHHAIARGRILIVIAVIAIIFLISFAFMLSRATNSIPGCSPNNSLQG